MGVLIQTSLICKPSFRPSPYPSLPFNGDVSCPRIFPRNPNYRISIPLRISLSSEQSSTSDFNLSQESRADSEFVTGRDANSNSIEVIGIGSRKDAVLDFCLESPFQSSTSLRFWNLQLKESGEVQLLRKSREQDSVLRNVEGPVSQLSSSRAIVLVASAGYGIDHVTAIQLLRAIKSANGLAVGIVLKPFNFEGQRRQDEVNDLVSKLWEHTNFCIVVDTDALLKREVVTLAEALRSANNAVLLAMDAIFFLFSDMHTKFLDRPNSKVKDLKVQEVADLLESYKKAKVGFGAGNNMKSSIARAVFDCPFLDEGLKETSMVVCTVTSCNVINSNDMHDFLQTFRQTTGFKKDIVISVVHEPNMEPNLIVTTLITLGCNEQTVPPKQGFLSRMALRFPFVFSILGRDHPEKDTLVGPSPGNTLEVIISSGSVDMPNLESAEGGDGSPYPSSEELETVWSSNNDETHNLRQFNDNDKRETDETLEGDTDFLSNVYGRTAEEEPAFQREPLISRNVRPGYHMSQEWAKDGAISGAAPVLVKQSFFALPVGVKPFGQSTESMKFSNTPQPSEPRALDEINGLSQGTPDILSWDTLTDASVEAVMDVYNAASTLLKGKKAAIHRKEGVLSVRAASMLETERDSEKKWSPTMEMQYRGGIYSGRCQGGLPEGKGRLTLPDGSIYDGMWRNGKRSGLGTFYYSNGDVFQGSWRDDLMHGRGWFFFHTGDRWFVNFWKGKPNGEGRFYSKGGEIFFGSFQDGWRHGDSLFIDVEGRRWAEIWDEGVLLSREQLDSELSVE